jgi:hypothetical protein
MIALDCSVSEAEGASCFETTSLKSGRTMFGANGERGTVGAGVLDS